MPFTLEVQFSGLCLYVVDDTRGRVGILMPDCRLQHADDRHEDGTRGEPHVGYVRFDLADLDPRFLASGGEDPLNEGVHQFQMEELEFVVTGAAPSLTVDLALPEFEEIAPHPDDPGRSQAVPLPGLFGTPLPPTTPLLMRTILKDGDLKGEPVESWYFPSLLRPGKPTYKRQFARYVTWTRPVESVTLRLKRFADGLVEQPVIEIPLKPPEGSGEDAVVHVKVANFCATNPLEWQNLGLRRVDEDDEDFKWLYRLLKPGSATWGQVLDEQRFPIPMKPFRGETGVEDCLGAQIKDSVV